MKLTQAERDEILALAREYGLDEECVSDVVFEATGRMHLDDIARDEFEVVLAAVTDAAC